jgi:hypothetical protein
MDVKHSEKKQLAPRPASEEAFERCEKYLCANGVNSERAWRNYALKNHPDKIARRTPASDRLYRKISECWARHRQLAQDIAGKDKELFDGILNIDCSRVDFAPPLGHSFRGSSPSSSRSDSKERRERLRLNAPAPAPPLPPPPPRARRPGLVVTAEDCRKFRRNPHKNPLTGRKIWSKTVRKLRRACAELEGREPRRAKRARAPVRILTNSECSRLRRNFRRNPATKRAIKPTARTARVLAKNCGPSTAKALATWIRKYTTGPKKKKRLLTRAECDQLRANPHINPATRRRIKPTGPTATRLLRSC